MNTWAWSRWDWITVLTEKLLNDNRPLSHETCKPLPIKRFRATPFAPARMLPMVTGNIRPSDSYRQ